MDIAVLKKDPEKEIRGVWVDGPQDLRLLVARYRNTKHVEYLTVHGAQVRSNTSIGLDTRKEALELAQAAVAHTVLLDWQNVSFEGKPLQYSPEAAVKLFSGVPDFFELVLGYSQDLDRFRLQREEGK